jgi:hypothetical protein
MPLFHLPIIQPNLIQLLKAFPGTVTKILNRGEERRCVIIRRRKEKKGEGKKEGEKGKKVRKKRR